MQKNLNKKQIFILLNLNTKIQNYNVNNKNFLKL